MFIKATIFCLFTAIAAPAQTNNVASTNQSPAGSLPASAREQRREQIRTNCIQNRRMICGKILKVLPEGLVVDSGYTNLMRYPLNRSWLVPGSAVAVRAEQLVEGSQPDAVCT